MKVNININGRLIGDKEPPYIVAELSANHNGSIENALKTISMAKKCGADAIKLQTYTPDTITIKSEKSDFMIKEGLWSGKSLYELYESAYTPYEWHEKLFAHSRNIGITCFSTPFDKTAVDLLEDLNAPAYKIASFEIIDLPLIKYVALTGKPMIMSTGMANQEEIMEAVEVARANGCKDLILLHCISSYPAPVEQSNLAMINELSNRYGVIGGLSDHSLGIQTSLSAVALGASFIEKHFILDREIGGPDSTFSIEPRELELLCAKSKIVFSSVGSVNYKQQESELENIKFRRSIYFVKDLKLGQIIKDDDIRCIRPGYGLKPKHYDDVVGRAVKMDVECGMAVQWDLINE